MTWFTRQQVLDLVEIEEGFLLELEEEEIDKPISENV